MFLYYSTTKKCARGGVDNFLRPNSKSKGAKFPISNIQFPIKFPIPECPIYKSYFCHWALDI